MAECRVKHVVVDSGGFIRNAPLKDIGEHVYSLQDVVSEIRDKATRQRLQVLPYELKFREPPTEAIKIVTDFSKKTGDYRSLSAVDIKVIALVYQLEKETNGTSHIKTEPQSKATWSTTKRHLEKPTEIAGFYLKKDGDKEFSRSSSRTTSTSQPADDLATGLQEVPLHDDEDNRTAVGTDSSGKSISGIIEEERSVELEIVDNLNTHSEPISGDSTVVNQSLQTRSDDSVEAYQNSDIKSAVDSNQISDDASRETVTDSPSRCADGETLPSSCILEGSESDEETESEDDDDDGGWITPSNIAAVKKSMGLGDQEMAAVDVGCLTTDFSMQNVLIQMGLNVISVDGMLIRRAKSYVQRCSACLKISTNMEKEFCPNCGNHTLQRVSMSVDDDGNIQYFLSRRKAVNLRGLRHSLPAPKGGKYATNPLLCEDQPFAHQRMSKKAQVKYNVFEAGYVANNSPFAPTDIYSRSAQLGFAGHKKRKNPNENKKVYGRRK